MGLYRQFFILLALSVTVVACGTYRSSIGEYRGIGAYRAPSDYAAPPLNEKTEDSYTPADQKASHNRVSGPYAYPPHEAFKLDWPVGTVHVNRGFHGKKGRSHEGLDLGGSRGAPIFAAHSGVVVYAGHGYHGYGNMVLLEFDKEWASLYGHLDRILVKQGQVVQLGTAIGTMGKTGHATGVHLHFELLHNQIPVDPLPLLTTPGKLATKPRSRSHASL